MIEVVICEPVRTPVGRFLGALRHLAVQELAEVTLRALIERSGVDPERIDDVVLGQGYPNGEAPALGRLAALDAGLGPRVTGLQVDRRCGSGLQAVCDAAMRVQTGVSELVVAGGAESMSQVEHYSVRVRDGIKVGTLALEDRLSRARITAGGGGDTTRSQAG